MRHSRYPAASCPICFDDLVGAEDLKNNASSGDAGEGTWPVCNACLWVESCLNRPCSALFVGQVYSFISDAVL